MLIFSGVELHLFSTSVLLSLLAICLLLILSAFISASEVAYFSLTSADLVKIDNEHVHTLLKNPNELLATILITNNFINVGIVVISAYLTSIAVSFPEGSILEFVFQVVVITSLLLLFGVGGQGALVEHIESVKKEVQENDEYEAIRDMAEEKLKPYLLAVAVKMAKFVDLPEFKIEINLDETVTAEQYLPSYTR